MIHGKVVARRQAYVHGKTGFNGSCQSRHGLLMQDEKERNKPIPIRSPLGLRFGSRESCLNFGEWNSNVGLSFGMM